MLPNRQSSILDPQPSHGWHNELPEWLVQDDRYGSLTGTQRAVLQAVADGCDAPDEDGHLFGCLGGTAVIDRAGISRRTFWRAVKRLIELGHVVQLARGGVIGTRNFGNVYAVPGWRGGLDSSRCRPPQRPMVPGPDGRWRPQPLSAGDQARLWSEEKPKAHSPQPKAPTRRDAGAPQPPSSTLDPPPTGVVPPAGGGSAKRDAGTGGTSATGPMARVPSWHTTIVKDFVKPRLGGVPQPRKKSWSVGERDLHSLERLKGLFAGACERGWVRDCDCDRLRFVAAAVHARRKGATPAALFAAIVRRGRWLYITNGDEEGARRWRNTQWRVEPDADDEPREVYNGD